MRATIIPLLLGLVIANPGAAQNTRIFFLGNSLTDQVKYDWFEKLADESGHPVEYSRHMIPGAPIRWLHTHPDGGFTKRPYGPWKKALSEFQWDKMSFQPFSSYEGELAAAVAIAQYTLKKSPDIQFYWYAQWPSRDGSDWESVWLSDHTQPGVRQSGRSRSFYEDSLLDLRKRLGDGVKPVMLIPAGHAFHRLDHKMRLGLVPGYDRIWQVYADGVHVGNVGSYIVAMSFYTTMFQTSPVGLPVGEFQRDLENRNETQISPELAKIIQQTVWEAVATNPLTGVTTDEPVRIADMVNQPAVAGSQYRFELLPSFGKPPYRWSVAAGDLPDGIALTSDGVLRGTTTSVGDHVVDIAVTDGRAGKAAKKITLRVAADTTPRITTTDLPTFHVGQFIEYQLKAASNNPPLRWAEETIRRKTTMPIGLDLTEGGLIRGTPGAAGTSQVKITVTDGDTVDAESQTLPLTFAIEPAGDDVVIAKQAKQSPRIDGKLDPSEGWDLRHPIEKIASGNPRVKAVCDVQWNKSGIYFAVKVTDPDRHFDERKPSGKMDGIELFIDARNNREATYNVDDRHAIFTLSGGKTGTGSLFTIDAKGAETDDGYIFEGKCGWWTLGTGSGHVGKAIGLDIAVNDSADGKTRAGQIVWHGSATNDEDPSQYRTIILGE